MDRAENQLINSCGRHKCEGSLRSLRVRLECWRDRTGFKYHLLPSLFKTACGHDRSDVLPILLAAFPGSLDPRYVLHACRRGSVHVVRMFMIASVIGAAFVTKGFLLACQHPNPGSLGIVVHVTNQGGYDARGFPWACRSGNVQVVQWLSVHFPPSCCEKDLAFRWACEHGRIQIVEWLLGDESIDIRSCSAYAAVMAVRNGHKDIVAALREAYVNRGFRLLPSLNWGGLRSAWIHACVSQIRI